MPLFPYPNMQELNLDWILTKVKNILRFVPDDGAVGQILRRTRSGAEWSDEQGGGGGSVQSVNGQTGVVVLDADDVGALPDSYVAPVTSVNGQTGTVVLDAADVGALPDSTSIPTDTADLTNSAGFVTAAGAAAAAPVQSVNGQTGAVVISTGGAVDSVNGQTGTVVLDADDVGALPDTYVAPVTSVNGQTGAVVLPGAEWDEPEITGITFPFTPTVDGIMSVIVVPPSNTVSYFYIDDSTLNAAWSRGYVTGYFPYMQTFPVIKGHRYFVVAQQNAGTPTIRFTPLK